VESRFERESGTVFLEIRETLRLWDLVRCPKEGGEVTCYDHTEVLTRRHLNVFQHRCEITCRLPRGKCRQCGHLFRVRPPWEGLSTHFTKEFEAFALLLMREMPMSKVAEMVGETDSVAKPQPTNPSTVRVFVTILILVQNSNLLLPAKHLRL
jgi:transposase